ncbi:MAG: hypothetical protein ACRDQ7_11380, partial [Haloechinothrix sp.]
MRRLARLLMSTSLITMVLVFGPPAAADHTDPQPPLAPTDGTTASGIVRGEGTWQHIANFPGGASPALSGGGTDLE